MERRSIRANPSVAPYWHRQQRVQASERLVCPCGATVYEGPKPNFSRVSCPKCKQIMDVPKDMRKSS